MPRRRALGRVGLLLLGALAGFALSLVVVYLLVDRWRTQRVEERVAVQLGLPDVAFDVEEVEEDGSLRIVLQNVAFLDSAGDTLVSAPRARARLLASSLGGDGPIVLDQGEVVRPYLRLIQRPDGEFNVFDIFAVEADGQPVRGAAGGAAAEGRPIVFRGIRVVDGRARIALPYQPAGEAAPRFASTRQPERVRWGGRWYTLHTLSDLDATMNVRLAAGRGWRVEIGSASATVTNPDMRIAAFAGTFEERGDQVLRFDVNTFRTGSSSLDAEGTVTLGGEAPVYDVTLRAHPLAFADLQGMGFPIPREGTASFSLGIETLAANRTRWTVTDANVAVLGSRASGSLTAITGPGAEPVFTSTNLTLDPLRLSDLETLGYVDRLPLLGEVTGTITSLDALEAERGGALRVNLAADLRPRDDPSAPPSILAARGVIRVGAGENAIRFDGLRVEAEPVNLATFRALMPGRESLLRGTLRGGATITGTMSAFRIEGGDLAYVVGDAPETRLRGLSGEVRLEPTLSYTLQASADPLALATLTELFPALPFRSATLSGPIRISGNPERVAFDVDLTGAAGGIDAQGTLALGGPVLGFDVRGRLEAFRTAALLTSEAPLEGPVSGTFEARGTAEDFRFAVDLTQGELGRFALSGTVRRPGGSPAQFDVAGRVDNFRLGYLLGRPGLLPGPVSGPIRLSGGGRAPLRFDVELQGAGPRGVPALLDLKGWYLAGAVPRYAVAGRVAGIDLSGLPGMAALPRTRLTGAIAIDGEGTTPETFAGRIDFTASPGSTIGGIPLEAGVARIVSDGGVIRVDTLLFAIRGARLEARGAVGVERPAPEPLTFTFQAPNLAALRPLVPGGDTLPELAGAVALSGSLAGTVRAPVLAVGGTARGLRYGAWAASTLDFTASGSKDARGWAGTARLQGTEVELAFGGQRFETLTLETNLTPDRASFGFTARRDAETDLAASGTLELDRPGVRGVILNTLDARIGGVAWTLAERARIAWSADRGLEVENLLLRRTGAATGLIAADGVLPPRGAADFRFEVRGLDLRELRRLLPQLPDAGGIVTASGVIDGAVENPRLTLDARVDSLQYGGVTADSLALSARYADRRMVLGGGVRLGEREVLAFDASIPMSFTLGGIVPGFEVIDDGALTATIAADSLPLALVAQTFPQVTDASGVARARIEVRGTPADPTVNGRATVENGALTIAALGAPWRQINGSVSLQGEEIRIDSLTARTGDQGRAWVNGSVLLDDPAAPAVNLAVRLEDFQVIDDPEVASLESTADIRLTGRLPGVEATGSVSIEDGEI
jgi:autotransporter translocation and assembly factor TamB